MKHLTTFMRCSAMLLLLAVVGVQSAWAQTTDTLYVERNGRSATAAADCALSNPCSFATAAGFLSTPTDPVIAVRVRSSGSTVRLKGDVTLDEDVEFHAWTEDGEAISSTTPNDHGGKRISATIILEGDVTLEAKVTALEYKDMKMMDDPLTVFDESKDHGGKVSLVFEGDITANEDGAFAGDVLVGGGSSSATITLAECNPVFSVASLTVLGDVKVAQAEGQTDCTGITLSEGIMVMAGTLDMADYNLTLAPMGEDAKSMIAAGAAITGDDGVLELQPNPAMAQDNAALTQALLEDPDDASSVLTGKELEAALVKRNPPAAGAGVKVAFATPTETGASTPYGQYGAHSECAAFDPKGDRVKDDDGMDITPTSGTNSDPLRTIFPNADDESKPYDPKDPDALQVFAIQTADRITCSATIPSDGILGIVTKINKGVTPVTADATATPPRAAVKAAAGYLEYKPFSVTDGFGIADVVIIDGIDVRSCYEIEGGGALDIDITKTDQGGVCVDVPTIGGGGAVRNNGGALILRSTTTVDGDFINAGQARTEFWRSAKITGSMEINGTYEGSGGDPEMTDELIGMHDLHKSGASEHVALQGARVPGVVAYNALDIEGDLDLRDTNESSDGVEWDSGLVLSGDSNPAKRDNARATEKKVRETGAIVSTVRGSILSSDTTYVQLGDHDRFHNLTVEGDVSMRGGDEAPYVIKQSEYVTKYQQDETEGNICRGTTDSEPVGNSLVLAGDTEQIISLASTLALNALTVAKSGSGKAIIERGAITAGVVDLVSGEIVTDGNLSTSEVRRSGGSVAKGEGEMAFASPPTVVSYVGGDQTTGDEIQGAKIGTVQVSSSGTITLSKDLEIAPGGHLYLANGTLSSGANTLSLNRNVTVHHGAGELAAGEGGEIALPNVVKPVDKYDNAQHGLTLAYKDGGERSVGMAWPAGAEAPGVIGVRNVEIDGTMCKEDPVVTLNDGFSRFDGNVTITKGTLNINGQHLVAFHELKQTGSQMVTVGEDGNLMAGDKGVLHLASATGAENVRDVTLNLYDGKSIGALIVKKEAKKVSTVTVTANAADATIRIDSLVVEHGDVEVHAYVKQLNVSTVTQNGGAIMLADTADDLDAAAEGDQPQSLVVGTEEAPGKHMISGDATFTVEGGNVTVNGDYRQGPEVMLDDDMNPLPSLANATFYLDGGKHVVTGNFHVAQDLSESGVEADKTKKNSYNHGPCGATDDVGELVVGGNYAFHGTGACTEGDDATKGLSGLVTFNGEAVQSVMTDNDAAAQFGSVTINSSSKDGVAGVMLMGPVMQNMGGILTLTRGVINAGDEGYTWSLLNTGIEEDLATSNTSQTGTIQTGSRNSYVAGNIGRSVVKGNSGSGVVTGGYLFPVGAPKDPEDAGRQVDRFRPMTLQFSDDLVSERLATVSALGVERDDLEWPEDGIIVDGSGGGTIALDVVGDIFWRLSFDGIPDYDPNVRVAADGLANVFDASGLRLVQWDCDMTNPRLAGIYDLDQGQGGDNDFNVNDRINGILNLTQEGVEVEDCNIIGIAANYLQNPISAPPIQGGIANVQFIQNVADDAVDVWVSGNRVLDNWAAQTATAFTNLGSGEHTVEVVAATAEDNSSPLASTTATFAHEGDYNVILYGPATAIEIEVVSNVRRSASDEEQVDFYLVHGAAGVPAVDIRLIDPIDNDQVIDLLANNVDYSDVGSYLSLAPGGYNFEVTTADNSAQLAVFRVELQHYRGQAVVMNLVTPTAATVGRGMMGVDGNGDTFFPDLITSNEADIELPDEFALQGNYPNPFNPATSIQIDLPENAEVTIQVVDMLGRHVMTVPTQKIDAGAKRAVELDGSNLASGTYLYRVIAKMASGTHIDSGRMVLVK